MVEMMFYAFLGGFAFFLLGMSVFMYFENRKFEDNQHMIKLLPPPPKLAACEPDSGKGRVFTPVSLSISEARAVNLP